jgi:hypothetical protein
MAVPILRDAAMKVTIAYIEERPFGWTEADRAATGADIDLADAVLRASGVTRIESAQGDDPVGFLEGDVRTAFGRNYAAEPDVLVAKLAKDEAIAAADTLLLTVPNQLGVKTKMAVRSNSPWTRLNSRTRVPGYPYAVLANSVCSFKAEKSTPLLIAHLHPCTHGMSREATLAPASRGFSSNGLHKNQAWYNRAPQAIDEQILEGRVRG